MGTTLGIIGTVVACGPEEEVPVVQVHDENKVQPVKFRHSNIYFIETQSGHILVDAGMPNMEEKLDNVFREVEVEPESVQLIIATHGHLDHVGSIAYARKMTGGQVVCHRSFADDMANGKAEKAVPQNLLGRLLNVLTGLIGNNFEGTKPDIVIDDGFDLGEFGIAGKIIHTPGHSPSSVSIVLENGEALVGDMVRPQGAGGLGLGMFYQDRKVLLESLERVAAFEPSIIYLSHGDRTDSNALRECIEANK